MLSYKRSDRVAELIHRELSQIILQQVSDPRVKAVNITQVKLSPDLRVAKIYVGSLEKGADKEQTLKGLHSARNFMRGELGHKLSLRVTPELVFKWDDSVEYSLHIAEVIADLHKSEKPSGEDTDE